MPNVVNGLPAHVLLLHVVVVLVPLACLATVLHAAWPRARRRLGIVTPVLALVALAFVPLTTHAGGWLRNRLRAAGNNSPAIQRHVALGHNLWPFAVGVFVLAAGLWVLGRYVDGDAVPLLAPASGQARAVPGWLPLALCAVSVVLGAVTVWQLYRVGDSGAHAAWDYVQKLPTSSG